MSRRKSDCRLTEAALQIQATIQNTPRDLMSLNRIVYLFCGLLRFFLAQLGNEIAGSAQREASKTTAILVSGT